MGTAPWEALGECWRLRHQERAQLSPQNNQENPSHKKLADLHLEKYSFPVEMMICLPNGTVVGSPQYLHPARARHHGAGEPESKGTDLQIASGFRAGSTTSCWSPSSLSLTCPHL